MALVGLEVPVHPRLQHSGQVSLGDPWESAEVGRLRVYGLREGVDSVVVAVQEIVGMRRVASWMKLLGLKFEVLGWNSVLARRWGSV